jgi:tetratricopeptide (TPR) repeat protein
VVAVAIWATAIPAWADDPAPAPVPPPTPAPLPAPNAPPPTKDQLDAAKKAFDEAQTLYTAGKYHEAIDKLQESYRLSHNVFLLYNIGHSYDQLGDKPKALAFYIQFLQLSAPGVPKRDETQKRIDELKAANVEADLEAVQLVLDEVMGVPKVKPRFKHAAVDSVAPGKSIEITVEVPKDAPWIVTLHYRAADEEAYTAEPLTTWRDRVLVGQIPGTKTTGSSLHYYIEAKDADGNLIVRSGKKSSPNLVKVEEPIAVVVKPKVEDPLLTVEKPHAPPRKLITPTTVSTTVAVVLIGGAITTYLIAKQKADDLEFDATACGQPPCQPFDGFDDKLENSGKRYNRIYQVTLVASVGAVGVAGYFWYRSLTKPKDKLATTKSRGGDWAFAPMFDARSAGVVTARRF